MKTEDVFKCLSESDRLRIMNLLAEGPLCGCNIQEILGMGQVKVSKQLAYLKKLGAVDSLREANWVVYRLSEPVNPVLSGNLPMLRTAEAELAGDLERRKQVLAKMVSGEKPAPEPVQRQCCFGKWRCHE